MSKANHTLRFPGDKSLSHRAAIFSAIAQGESHIENYLSAEDTMNTLSAFTFLGTEFKERGNKIIVRSPGIENWHSDAVTIDLGNSGTAARLLLGLFAGKPGSSVEITGDASLRKRPMARVTKVLEQYGAKYSILDKLPIRVDGVQLATLEHEETKGSAQIKSALMLAAIASQTKLSLHELKPSRDHTENILRFRIYSHLFFVTEVRFRHVVFALELLFKTKAYIACYIVNCLFTKRFFNLNFQTRTYPI